MELKQNNDVAGCFSYFETGSGAPLHFSHANGFPAGVYERILDILGEKHRVIALNYCNMAPCAPGCACRPPEIKSWHQLADQFITFLDAVNPGPVIGAGHSFGGVVTLLASIKRPELFRKLILLDPVILEPRIVRLWSAAEKLGRRQTNPLGIRALKRRNGWKDREEAFEYFKDKPLFSDWDKNVLRSYTERGLIDTPEGVKLLCPPEIEAMIFDSYAFDIWRKIRKVTVPTLVIRGERSDVMTDVSWAALVRARPDMRFAQFDGLGHLFPMQAPEKTAAAILDFTS